MAPPPPASSIRELNKAISGGELEPVYLLHGEEEYLRDAKVEKLIDAALDPSERDFNLSIRDAAELSAEDVDALLNTPPLLASRRVVVVRGVSNLKKGARQVLDRYLESPAPDLLLLLLESGTVLKTEKTLPDKCAVVEFRRLSRDELQKWVQQHVTGVLNMTISQSGATLLLGAVGDDLAQLASELDKLASQPGRTYRTGCRRGPRWSASRRNHGRSA